MDIHAQSAQLLERLANSIYDREGQQSASFAFTTKEIHIVESWLKDVVEKAFKHAGEY